MKPFLQGRKTLAVEPLRVPPASIRTHGTPCAPGKSDAVPKEASNAIVEVVKEGDKVVRLIITCACGERIEIDCLYPAGG